MELNDVKDGVTRPTRQVDRDRQHICKVIELFLILFLSKTNFEKKAIEKNVDFINGLRRRFYYVKKKKQEH